MPVLFGSAERGNGITRLLKALRHEAPTVSATRDRLGVAARRAAARACDEDDPHRPWRQALRGAGVARRVQGRRRSCWARAAARRASAACSGWSGSASVREKPRRGRATSLAFGAAGGHRDRRRVRDRAHAPRGGGLDRAARAGLRHGASPRRTARTTCASTPRSTKLAEEDPALGIQHDAARAGSCGCSARAKCICGCRWSGSPAATAWRWNAASR